ncbi:MAG: alpha-mannosidase [Clostridiales bacterium]|nr:alpha-mannosidase [Clostridiales bacterium]
MSNTNKEKKTLFMIGNAHLDPAWLWDWREGFAEVLATFRSALDRMKEYDDFVFTCSSAAYYEWIEENEPEMFEEIKARVKEGRWVIVGGWWVQADCNIPSGESFARHALYSQRYYKEKFGITCKVGYNVDSFGHNSGLPQIYKKSGMDNYVFMRPSDSEKPLPYLFKWESLDGSQVTTYKIFDSYCVNLTDVLFHKFNQIKQGLTSYPTDTEMLFYGVGNHGGGPTKEMIDVIIENPTDMELKFASPEDFFALDEIKNADLPVIKEDLQHHASGCYSAVSMVKDCNRRAENRMLNAEKFMSVAHLIRNHKYNSDSIARGWKKILFNQFHDILCGCSIKPVYDDARDSFGEALNISSELLNSAVQRIAYGIDTMHASHISGEHPSWEMPKFGKPVVFFNPLSWDVKKVFRIAETAPVKGLCDSFGNVIPVQKVRAPRTNGNDDKYAWVADITVPALGYSTYWIMYENNETGEIKPVPTSLKTTSTSIENDNIKVEFNSHRGYIESIFDKKNNVEVLKGYGAVPVVIDEYHCDTWSHNVFSFRRELGRFSDAKVTVVEEGPIRSKICVENRYNSSVLTQYFTLEHDSDRIVVDVKLDWREKHKMLKLAFPVAVQNATVTYENAYGYIKKVTNGEEEAGQTYFDCTGENANGKYGLTITNNSKYSYDCLDSEMRLTAVRSPIYADHYGFNARDELAEFTDQGISYFTYELIPHMGELSTARAARYGAELNNPVIEVATSYHEGKLPPVYRGISCDKDNVIITVFKRAEDDNGYILRGYETDGVDCDAHIEIPALNRSIDVKFGHNEIKTLWLGDDGKSMKELLLTEL